MSFAKLAEVLDFGVKKDAICSALLREGFHRRLAMRKLPITEKNRKIRLAWAKEHVNWTLEQWYQIL
jgi:Transposase